MNAFEQGLQQFFSASQLHSIQSTRVVIGGAGGLGSNVALHLVRSGFRKLKLIDFDRICASNLNRQFFFAGQIGRLKVDALAENLHAINSSVELELCDETVTSANIATLFDDWPIIVEAFDRPESKKLLAEYAIPQAELFVAASGLAGWDHCAEIRPHRLRDNFYVVGDLTREIGPDHPPLSPRVAIAAAMQADLVLSFVLNSIAKEVHHV